ncbi:MAG: hypothetical protein HYU29_04890 [Chloroflexi bacterium]|nr:hypothetical protein [Chloroflexota bacterium]
MFLIRLRSGRPGASIVALLLAVILMALQSFPARAQDEGQIVGRVISGTVGASVPASLEVALTITRGGSVLFDDRSELDSEGAFRFSGFPVGQGLLYTVSTVYGGVNYSAIVEGSSMKEPVTLFIYETTSSIEGIKILDNSLTLTGVDGGRREAGFLQWVILENGGDRTFVPDLSQAPTGLLRFSMPPGAAGLDIVSTLKEAAYLQVDRGFAIASPLPPGRHDLMFTYSAPYSGQGLEFTYSFAFATRVFRFLAPVGVGDVIVPQAVELPTLRIGQKEYRLFEGRDLGPGARVELSLADLPQPSLLALLRHGATNKKTATGALAAFMAGILALFLLSGWRGSKKVPPVEGRAALIEAVAHLDDLLEEGEMGRDEYLGRRAQLKRLLLQNALQEKQHHDDRGREKS